ncbi:MAG TPA: response regulator transcription factor [Gaiellaceae bacterium]
MGHDASDRAATGGPVRVLIVDDHPIFAEALKALLEQEDGLLVVGTAGTAVEGLELAASADADVVLMDHGLPGMDGIEAIRRLRARQPWTRVVLVSGRAGEVAAAAREAGAMAVLYKGNLHTEVAEIVLEVASLPPGVLL